MVIQKELSQTMTLHIHLKTSKYIVVKTKFVLVTTGIPRDNGQVETLSSVIIAIVLSVENPEQWFKHVSSVQMALNSSYQRSIAMTPF